MADQTSEIRPPAFWYAISVVILVGGVGFAFWLGPSDASSLRGNAMSVRGDGSIQIESPGSYSLYVYRAASDRQNGEANQAWRAAKTATVVVRRDGSGDVLPVRNVYETIELHGSLFARLVEFEVREPGAYRVHIAPPLMTVKPAVRPSEPLSSLEQQMMGFVVKLIIAVGVGLLSSVLAIVMFVVVFMKRGRAKLRLVSGS